MAARVLIPALLALTDPAPAVAEARCPDRPACTGCGCKGGPGYRGPDGRCVSFRMLDKVCGDPPTQRCVFENAPGTGLNRDCAAGRAGGSPAAAAAPEED